MPWLALRAPVSGVLVPLDMVPDPVFAQRMVGDGISIDPTSSTLLAPCAGRVAHVHDARHVITITTPDGLEVMIHVGLDTVKLRGEGFTVFVAEGDDVCAGQPLLAFDADDVARHAHSLLTQLVITNGERVASMTHRSGTVTAGRDIVLEVELRAPVDTRGSRGDARVCISGPIRITNPLGLHARPAAVLARAARAFDAAIALLGPGETVANAKSVVSLIAMEVAPGHAVRVRTTGVDAERALATLVPLVASGLGEEPVGTAAATSSLTSAPDVPVTSPGGGDPDTLFGVAASPGVAAGHVFQLRHDRIDVVEHGSGPGAERRTLDTAIGDARLQLRDLSRRLEARAEVTRAAILAVHEDLIGDPEIMDTALEAIADGKSAAWAWSRAIDTHATRLAGLGSALIAARANDLRDVGRRVLRLLSGTAEARSDVPANAILVADDLTPSETARLDRTKVLGVCTTTGGATSHVAILARALDIPAIAAIDPRALDLPDGTPAVLDGNAGRLRLHPTGTEVARAREQQLAHVARRTAALASAASPAVTTDGHRIEVVANVGRTSDAEQVARCGGEGVGLLRSEFLFLDRVTAPGEDEQAERYAAISRLLGRERRLVIRTFDIGGDKSVSWLPMGADRTPAPSDRGFRLQLGRPDLLRTQLRAILRASRAGNVHVMFPMVTTMGEWRAAKAMLDAEREQLGMPAIPAGIMIEVPAAAIMAEVFAREVDFFSIGTNDLTQYTLAMDRKSHALASEIDGLNPAVLHLVAHTVSAAHAHGKWVGVCGGIADDEQAIPVLLGLGVDELSVSLPSLPGVKARVRGLSKAACIDLAGRALTADSAAAVRALVAALPMDAATPPRFA